MRQGPAAVCGGAEVFSAGQRPAAAVRARVTQPSTTPSRALRRRQRAMLANDLLAAWAPARALALETRRSADLAVLAEIEEGLGWPDLAAAAFERAAEAAAGGERAAMLDRAADAAALCSADLAERLARAAERAAPTAARATKAAEHAEPAARIDALEGACARWPDAPEPRMALARALARVDAQAHAARIVALIPDPEADHLGLRVGALSALGRVGDAVASGTITVKARPHAAQATLAWCRALRTSDRERLAEAAEARAVATADALIDADPTDVDTWATRLTLAEHGSRADEWLRVAPRLAALPAERWAYRARARVALGLAARADLTAAAVAILCEPPLEVEDRSLLARLPPPVLLAASRAAASALSERCGCAWPAWLGFDRGSWDDPVPGRAAVRSAARSALVYDDLLAVIELGRRAAQIAGDADARRHLEVHAAVALVLAEREPAALAAFERVITPSDRGVPLAALLMFADLLRRSGDRARSEHLFMTSAVRATTPEDRVAALVGLGRVRLDQGRADEAEALAEQALGAATTTAPAHQADAVELHARVQEARGQRARARHYWERADALRGEGPAPVKLKPELG